MKQALRKTPLGLAAAAGVAIAALAVLVAVWYFRPNASEVDPALTMELGAAVSDGMHNSNTDMTFWKGHFYLAHARSKYHMGNEGSSLRVLRSADAKSWTMIHEVRSPGEDVRDPKIVVMNGRLVLYVLVNRGFEPEPHGTAVTMTADGKSWTALEPVTPEGWLLWRPKTRDGRTWYVTAYWKDHGKSILLASRDGVRWDTVSTIHEGDRNDETAMEFLPDGRIIATARLEGTRSWHQGAMDASTLIAVAAPPYTRWMTTVSRVTRLDGPVLFGHAGRVFAAGRYDPENYDRWYGMSSLLGRKRTALYEVMPGKLVKLSDLPSAGDTSYPGAVLRDGTLYLCYYTNDVKRDYSWLLGLVMPSDIMLARIDMASLVALADARK